MAGQRTTIGRAHSEEERRRTKKFTCSDFLRHVGDLGNIESQGGKVKINVRDRIAMLTGKKGVREDLYRILLRYRFLYDCSPCGRLWVGLWSFTKTRTTWARGRATRRRSPRRRATLERELPAVSLRKRETRLEAFAFSYGHTTKRCCS